MDNASESTYFRLFNALRMLSPQISSPSTPTSEDKSALPNHQVLGCQAADHPRTLLDYGLKKWYTNIDATKTGDGLKDFFAFVRNFGFLNEVRHGGVFNNDLPHGEGLGMSNVYVVCGRGSTVVEGFFHLSIVTRGHCFHLFGC